MADEDLKAELERLKAENERLKNQRGRSVSLKVSEKGGVSVYGLGRFPVTLYKEQWTKLLAMTDELKAFIREHDAEFLANQPATTAGRMRCSNIRIGEDRSVSFHPVKTATSRRSGTTTMNCPPRPSAVYAGNARPRL